VRASIAVLAVAAVTVPAASAVADSRGVLRFGVMALELEPSSDTPLFGRHVERAMTAYNAAAAYDQMRGGTMQPIEARQLGVSETLYVVSPGFEVGGEHYFFRIEAPIGHGGELTSVGLGVYPLNLQVQLRRGLVAYVSFGGSASWLDRAGDGDLGGLVTARAAGGVRIARYVVVEVGYSAFALGGSIHPERLERMASGDLTRMEPEQVLAAGDGRGLLDVELGVAFW
jgi:hypothetical protein